MVTHCIYMYIIALEAAIELWRLLLTDRFSMLEDWIQFLQVNVKNHMCILRYLLVI